MPNLRKSSCLASSHLYHRGFDLVYFCSFSFDASRDVILRRPFLVIEYSI